MQMVRHVRCSLSVCCVSKQKINIFSFSSNKICSSEIVVLSVCCARIMYIAKRMPDHTDFSIQLFMLWLRAMWAGTFSFAATANAFHLHLLLLLLLVNVLIGHSIFGSENASRCRTMPYPLHCTTCDDGVGGYLSIYLNEFTFTALKSGNTTVCRNSQNYFAYIDACSHIVTTSQQINYTLVSHLFGQQSLALGRK